MLLSPKETIDLYRNSCRIKRDMPAERMLGKGILAGMMIGMGAAASNVAAHGVTDVGIARLVAAVVFPVGLMMVILMGAELFTGDCLIVVGIPEKDIRIVDFAKILALVYLGNLIGGVALAWLVAGSGQLDYSNGLLGAYTIKVALGKVMLTADKAIISGILCNILVCAAVIMALCAKDAAGKVLISFFVIMLFVVSGFEHCVANMYYISAGMIAKMNPKYVIEAMQHFGIEEVQLDMLNIQNMIIHNLIPVTLGNIIGGAFCVGLPIYYLNRDKKAVSRLKEVKENGRFHNENARRIAR